MATAQLPGTKLSSLNSALCPLWADANQALALSDGPLHPGDTKRYVVLTVPTPVFISYAQMQTAETGMEKFFVLLFSKSNIMKYLIISTQDK